MREIIEQVLEAEKAAKAKLAAAHAEAEALIADARKKADAILQSGQAEARTEARRMVETAVSTAQEERQKIIVEAQNRFRSALHVDEAIEHDAVEAVVHCVCDFSLETK